MTKGEGNGGKENVKTEKMKVFTTHQRLSIFIYV